MADLNTTELDIGDQIAHIDLMLAEIARKGQERQLAPWQVAFTGLAAGAALFAAGGAFFKLLGV